jgi:hypothetical protein
MKIAEEVQLEEPVYIYNFVLETCHVIIVNGYECVTLGHNLAEPEIYHPYYGTNKITEDLLTLPVAANGQRTAPGIDQGGNGDYATQGTRS